MKLQSSARECSAQLHLQHRTSILTIFTKIRNNIYLTAADYALSYWLRRIWFLILSVGRCSFARLYFYCIVAQVPTAGINCELSRVFRLDLCATFQSDLQIPWMCWRSSSDRNILVWFEPKPLIWSEPVVWPSHRYLPPSHRYWPMMRVASFPLVLKLRLKLMMFLLSQILNLITCWVLIGDLK